MKSSIPLDRRSALGLGLAGAAATFLPALAQNASPDASRPRLRALAFDGFTILDPRPVSAGVVDMVPGQGMALASAWSNKIFALSWLETSAGRYSGFSKLADAALEHSARLLKVELSAAQRRDLCALYGRLPAWPDAGGALARMRQAGMRLAFLSNLSMEMLESNMRANGLHELMETPLSTDVVRAFKPAPRAYAMAPDHFGLPREEIGFVAFGGWDALGAKWFGYRTAWINRLGVPKETLEPAPDISGRDLSSALQLAHSS